MRIPCPVVYEIFGVTETNRRPSRYRFRETMEIDIPEIDAHEAPVSARWTPHRTTRSDEPRYLDRSVSGPDGRQETRWFDNANWQRLCDGHFNGPRSLGKLTTAEHLEVLLSDSEGGRASCRAVGLGTPDFEAPIRTKHTDSDPRDRFLSISQDGRQLASLQIEEAMAGLIFVDGVLHRKCFEPFVMVEITVTNERVAIADVFIETTEYPLWAPTTKIHACFGVSEWERAMDFVHEYVDPEGNPFIVPVRPEILVETALDYDWRTTFPVALKARELQRMVRSQHSLYCHDLSRVIHSRDADEQHEIMQTLDPDANPDAFECALSVPRRKFGEIMDLLDGRPIDVITQVETPIP